MTEHKSVNKATLAASIFIIIFVIAYSVCLWYTNHKVLLVSENQISNINSSNAEKFGDDVADGTKTLKGLTDIVIDDGISSAKDMNADDLKAYYDGTGTDFSYITFISNDGYYACSNGTRGELTADEKKECFGSSETLPVVSFISDSDSRNTIYVSVPYTIDGKISGYMVGSFSGKEYKEKMNMLYSAGGINMISDKEGNLIFVSDAKAASSTNSQLNFDYTNIYDSLSDNNSNGKASSAVTDDISNNKSGVQIVSIQDHSYILAYNSIEGTDGWYSISLVPKSVSFQTMGYLVILSLLAGAFFLFCMIAITNSYARFVKRSHEKMKNIAYNDSLTGYPNYTKFKDDVKELLAEDSETRYYLYSTDMVGFRYINDASGYDTGDKILKEIADAINSLLLEGELFSRVSADRFVILAKRRFDTQSQNSFIYLLVDRISKIQPLASAHIELELQMGMYIIDEEARTNLSLNAMYDRALIALASLGHSDTAVAVYDSSMHESQIERKVIESKMHDALENGEFHVYVQPKYKTADGTLAAGEALIRWHDPEKGIIPPVQFIPLFEKNRFVHDIDLYVIDVICKFLRMRLNAGRPVVTISLNVSPVEITMPNFLASYTDIKNKYNIPDNLIELEFTEGIFFQNESLFKKTIESLKNNGFSCSLDDFGSGYSSLNVLKEMPVDVLKLDKLFFKESGDISRERSVIRSVVAMARSLNMKTVAEGVETLDTVEFLKIIGCTMIQGYVFARPMPLTEFEALMDSETISGFGRNDLELDKFQEVMPLDTPYDISICQTYQMIYEFNTSGDIYHAYKQEGCKLKTDTLPERSSYQNLLKKYFPELLHPSDVANVVDRLSPDALRKHFETNRDLTLEFRQLSENGQYIWVQLNIIRAQSNSRNNLILFGYVSDINTQKRQEETLIAAKSRFSSAFIGLRGIVCELDLMTGQLVLLEKTNDTLSIISEIKDYKTLVDFAVKNLVCEDQKNKVTEVCSIDNLKNTFQEKKENSVSIKVMAHPSRKISTYNWYECSYYIQQGSPNKLLITLQDITTQAKDEIAEKTLLEMNRLALCRTFDEIMEINLSNDTYKLTVITDRETGREHISEGQYTTLFEAACKYLFPPKSQRLMKDLVSIDAFRDFYKNSEMNEMSANIQRRKKFSADSQAPFYWYNMTVVAANRKDTYQDDIIYVYIRNIQSEKTSEKVLSDYARRLALSVSLYLYVFEFDVDTCKVTVIGGKNVNQDLRSETTITYNDLIRKISDEAVDRADRTLFNELCDIDGLLQYFETEGDEFKCSVRSRLHKGSVLRVTQIYDTREKLITVLIDENDN